MLAQMLGASLALLVHRRQPPLKLAFNLANFAPTSVGAFLNPLETNAALYKLASSLDFTTIWYLVLFGIGTAIVAGVKRTSGYIAVFGWWAIIVLFGVGWTAAFS